jgi:predicted nucleotidyltransferase
LCAHAIRGIMPPGEALGVDLASHVGEREAAAFTAALRTDSELPSHLSLSDMLAAVQAAAREVLGPEARAELAGSLAKGTATSSSDADVLVHSVAPVTLAQRQALEARLRAHPAAHPEHVRLRKLAIHARLFNIDCDVVCADTVEYGSCPGVDERVAADVTVARAAQALKFWASHAAARDRKLPGHALEAVALYVGSGDGARARPKAGDGVMQLFVAVLQQLADAARDGEASVLRRVTRLDAPTRADLSRHARATLHVFEAPASCARGLPETQPSGCRPTRPQARRPAGWCTAPRSGAQPTRRSPCFRLTRMRMALKTPKHFVRPQVLPSRCGTCATLRWAHTCSPVALLPRLRRSKAQV